MAIWAVFAIMTGLGVLAVLWPLSRRPRDRAPLSDDTAFYRAQIAEIDRDEARGLIGKAEAEAAKAEAGRRLLRAGAGRQAGQPVAGDLEGEPALRRRRAASTIAISTIPLVALTIYGVFGSPGLPAAPLAGRADIERKDFDLASAVARIEAHLAKNPDDGRGWEVIAPVYLRSGRAGDAARAYASALRIIGETPVRLADYGEALAAAAGGIVEADARVAFERAVSLDGQSVKARFYLAIAAEQDGRHDLAIARLKEMVADAPAGSPWVPAIEERIARLEGRDAAAAGIAGSAPASQKVAIRGMVDGLAARLSANGADVDGWLRLVRSYMVLGEGELARAALGNARKALANEREAMDRLAALAREMKLDDTGPRP